MKYYDIAIDDIARQITENSKKIAEILFKGKDVELRKTTGDRVRVVEVTKKIK